MAVREASSALTVRAVLGLYRDVWNFARWPTMAPARLALGSAFAIVFGALFALDCSLALGAFYLEGAIADAGHAFPDPIVEDYTFAGDFLDLVILAPLIEECLFRGWLRGDVAALRFAVIAWIAVGLVMISDFFAASMFDGLASVALIVLLFGLVQWLGTRQRETHVPRWFEAHYHWFVWGSTLAFGLIHLGNFEAVNGPIDLVLVASQTIGGLVLAYTRTRLGLGAAIAQHSAFNLIILAETASYG
ncbi:MAG: CPBP family glutamic-type intramembrane protease [Pseudomonadota bacterium]